MSDFIYREPLHGDFSPMPGHNGREGQLVEALHVDPAQTLVVRPAMDYQGNPVTDFDEFAERVSTFRDYAAEMPCAGFAAYFGPSGGVIVTEYLHGTTLNKAIHSLSDEGITKQLKSQVVKPTNDLVLNSIDYYKDCISKGRPMVVDVLKSDQFVVAPSAADKRPRPKLVDQDALIVAPSENGEYDALNRLLFTEFVICHMASLSIFLSNAARAPELRNPGIFDPTTHKVIEFVEWAEEKGMAPQATTRLEVKPFVAVRKLVEIIVSQDHVDNLTASAVGQIRESLRDARIALQNR